MNKLYVILSSIIIIYSCGEGKEKEGNIPKPPTFLRVDLPVHKYEKTSMDLPYSFEIPELYKANIIHKNNLDIKMGMLNNSTLKMSYKRLDDQDTVSLRDLIDFTYKKLDNHKSKASEIESQSIRDSEKGVYGTFFELKGDVAVPFQFYFTDSLNSILFGEVTLGSTPNWSTMQGELMYAKKDILRIFNSFEWINQEK